MNPPASGYPTYGHDIGIIMLNCAFQRLRGDMGNAATFPFPVLYEVVTDVAVDDILTSSEERFLLPFIAAAKTLQARGVKAITTSCGCLALHHRRLAAAVDIPLFASTLIQVPLVHQMVGCRGKVGLFAADSALLSEAHFRAVGWSSNDIPIAMASMSHTPEFPKLMQQNADPAVVVDFGTVEQDVRRVARELLTREPEVRAIVIECTNLVPYAFAIQAETGLPVFDIVTLTKMAKEAVTRARF